METDPRGVFAYAQSLPRGDQRSNLLSMLSSQWAATDPAEALAWASVLPQGDERSLVITNILTGGLAQHAPHDAAEAVHRLLSGEAQENAAKSIVSEWAVSEPSAAAAWAAGFPEGPVQESAFESIAAQWAQYDVDGAGGWLSGLPHGNSRDAAVGAFVDAVQENHPQDAAAWAETISDPNRRIPRLESVGRHWLAIDPPAAREWIARSSLSGEQKTSLLEEGK